MTLQWLAQPLASWRRPHLDAGCPVRPGAPGADPRVLKDLARVAPELAVGRAGSALCPLSMRRFFIRPNCPNYYTHRLQSGGRETSGGPRHAPAANISARTLPMRVRPLCLKATDRTHYTFTTRARLRPSPPQQPYSLCTRSHTPCTRPARTLLPRRAGRSVIVAHLLPCNLLRRVVVSTGLLLAALELVRKLRGLLAQLVVAME